MAKIDYDARVACKICGADNGLAGTKLCDGCWEMDRQFNYLVDRNPDAAAIWLDAAKAKLRKES
jgi:hypothetical protein